jgi:DNA-binding MarR family transcriptional regulator
MSVSKLIGLLEKVEEYLGHHLFRDIKVLAYLYQSEHSVVYYQSIIRDLDLTSVGVTRSLKLLSDRDMITISMDTEDTRKKSVSLTDKGNALKLHIIEILGNTNDSKSKSQ